MSRNELVQACLRNDRDARHQLIEQHYGSLMGMCRRYTKNNLQAETFFNEAFKDVFKHLSEYKDDDNLQDWVKRIVIKSLVLQLKNNRTEYYVTTTTRIDDRKQQPVDLFHQTEEPDLNQLRAEDYVRILQRIPASFRAIYNLLVIDQVPMKDTAAILEVSEESAKNSIERARFEFSKNVKLYLQGYNG